MAFISEIDYKGNGEGSGGEFVEITLLPGDDPEDFTLSFYDNEGTLHEGASSFFSGGEMSMQDIIDLAGGVPGTVSSGVGGMDLQVLPHPDNPAATIFIVPSTLASTNSGNGTEAVSLTNTATSTVLDAYDIGSNSNSGVFTEGAAAGTAPVSTLNVGNGKSIQIDSEGNLTKGVSDAGDSLICFCNGTLLATLAGERRVEDLAVGDVLLTEAGAYLPLRHVFSRRVSAQDAHAKIGLRPVRISKGSLGAGLPRRDLMVSRQHRLMARSSIVRRMFDQDAVLLAAHVLTALPDIEIVCPDEELTFWHLLLDRHAVLLANGTPAESLLLGKQTLHLIPASQRAQVARRFPEAFIADREVSPARLVPPVKQQKKLVQRHIKNGKAMIGFSRGVLKAAVQSTL